MYYFHRDIINLKKIESKLLKFDKNITKTLIFTTLDTLQLKTINDCESIYSVNPFYLLVNHANG